MQRKRAREEGEREELKSKLIPLKYELDLLNSLGGYLLTRLNNKKEMNG